MQPSLLVADDLRRGDLVEICPVQICKTRDLRGLPSRKHLAPKVRVFINFLAERFAAPQWD